MADSSDRLLDLIEELETQSLSWGFTDGSLSEEEVLALGLDCSDHDDAESLLGVLLDRRLLFEVKARNGTIRYRSRFAETARLLTSLRQMFPKKPWTTAPRLVSDFRIDRRRRRYPRRDLGSDAVLGRVQLGQRELSDLQRDALVSLLAGMELAEFQVRAIERIFGVSENSGTIITAGTGSGKTLAFYLPTLLRLVSAIDRSSYWVKALALYPRSELLKDQLAESFRLARLLDQPLLKHGKRLLSIGALYRSTPNSANDVADKWQERRTSPVGFVCPLLVCPACSHELVWKLEDVRRDREKLHCSSSTCSVTIAESALRLTRESLRKTPPDILFSTTEMLNQRMSDTNSRALFGIGVPAYKKPLLLLLDEVHTYVGTTGAQAALTLRRYRHALGSEIPAVGLSATLAEAPRFFAELTGIPMDAVAEVRPHDSEIIEEGAEYQFLLRGDPSAQAALLSTSIQAAMLLGRIMDPPVAGFSQSRFGERLFVFADDLDVANRLFDDLRDSEAYTMFGKPDPSRTPLAALRSAGQYELARDAAGQRWRLCEEIGRSLNNRLRIGRTTSQDPGVMMSADVIVATSTLEVGFNDSGVGAVLQHKAPLNAASFVQRRGRAGRVRQMRPLTVTVVSDYGRDRLAFQAYEHLFDPALPPQYLPISNDYVLRIQAVYSFMDWLAARLPNSLNGWMWDVLSRPTPQSYAALRAALRDQLEALLDGDRSVLEDLRRWLSDSLDLDSEVVEALLWEAPRALLLEAIPTLWRRLIRNWELADDAAQILDRQINYHPLPDYMPRQLFGELNLPEVVIRVPAATKNLAETTEHMGILTALTTLAPGRVTRRFATARGKLSHWYPIQSSPTEQKLPISTYCAQWDYLGVFGTKEPIQVYRPWEIRLEQAMRQHALPSSNAFPIWRTQMLGQGAPVVVDVPARSAWNPRVSAVNFYLHRFGSSVLVRRYAHEVKAELKQLAGTTSVSVEFCDEAGQPAAVGFEFEADGFCLDIELPNLDKLLETKLPDRLLASCRTAYLRYRILSDKHLPSEANPFLREWLCQLLLSAAIVRSQATGERIGAAASAVTREPNGMREAMETLFATQDPTAATVGNEEGDDADDAVSNPGHSAAQHRIGRLQHTLMELLAADGVRARLAELASELDDDVPPLWGDWLRTTLLETLGEAVLQACIAAAPLQTAIDTLVMDIDDGPEGGARLWITETTIGGAGAIQAFADSFSNEPRALFRSIDAVLSPTDLEVAADGLEEFLRVVTTQPEIAESAERMRASVGHNEREKARQDLWHRLSAHGLDVPRALAISLDARIFRPGSGRALDLTLRNVLLRWDQLEEMHNVAIGLREMAYIAAFDDEIAASMSEMIREAGASVPQSVSERAQVLAALLWPRGVEIRQRNLQSYNPFRRRRFTDPALIRVLFLDERVLEVDATNAQWRKELAAGLSIHGTVKLWTNVGAEGLLSEALVNSLVEHVDVGYLRFFPSVERIERQGGRITATLSLRECV